MGAAQGNRQAVSSLLLLAASCMPPVDEAYAGSRGPQVQAVDGDAGRFAGLVRATLLVKPAAANDDHLNAVQYRG